MKKEFGKWLMDVAKYMVTALLLSTIFADLNEPIIIYIVVILSIVVLLIGLLLVSDVHLYEDKSITNKKKGQKNEYVDCCRFYSFGSSCWLYLFHL